MITLTKVHDDTSLVEVVMNIGDWADHTQCLDVFRRFLFAAGFADYGPLEPNEEERV